ncbi:restriction endonuclease subunit S [Shewanella algae]|uniref:restriction endonuclease subunit S n=1 Tax=Shewanella algae TaxID=38313 RepID=UPI0011852914|nr:restriction endonuclease subunit S [Shewanella algae]TVP06088.1 hypothetical protein AYI73_12575 [Shewanella algae]BCV42079.1 hypothetical protein TUM17378_33410 [Shewanella algae]
MLGNKINNIPDGWKVEHIEDFASIKTGTGDTQDREDGGKYPFFVRSNTIERVNKYTFDGEGVLTSGDGVGVGKIYHYVNGKFHYHQRVYNIHNFKPHVLGRYFYQFFRYRFFQRVSRMSAKGSVDSVRMEMIAKMSILIPSIQEQRKIADILSTVDKKIDLIDQKIAETEKLKTGLMQKLFSEGVGVQDENGDWQPHTEFQDSIYGNIPKTWKLFKLNQVTDYVDYRGKTPPKVESGTFLVTAKNIKNGFIDYECSKEYIPSELYDDVMSRGKPKLGDVVFTTEAPLGNVALIDRSDVAIAQRVIKFRPKDDICLDSGYLKHFMLSTYFQKELLQNATGSTVLGVKGKRLHVMLVCLPSINEQKVIVDILNEVDRKKHFLELQKAETQQLKKGLMQKLLTGEWRVPFEETEAV